MLTSLRKWRLRDWEAEGQLERVASEQEIADFGNWIRGDIYRDLQGVMEVVSWTRELAVKAHSRFRIAADGAWREWVSEACLGGAGAAHRWTKECHGTPLEVGSSRVWVGRTDRPQTGTQNENENLLLPGCSWESLWGLGMAP